MAAGAGRKQRGAAHWYWEGRARLDAEDWKGAAEAFGRALAVAPTDAALHRARGLALVRLHRFGESIDAFRRAAALSPGMARAHSDLGVTLLKVNRAEEAIGPLERALAIDPGLEQALVCLGLACAHAGQPDRALRILDRSVAESADPGIHSARAWAMLHQGRVEEALATLDRVLSLDPAHDVGHYNRLFALQHRPGVTPAALLEAHRRWGEVALGRARAAPDAPPLAPLPEEGLPAIGIVSGDLRQHAAALLTLRAFEALARRGARIHCYANQSDEDGYTRRFRALAWKFHSVGDMTDEALHALIRRERVGILFDLAGLTARHRLPVFAARAAPVQVSWAGYTGTTGLPTMDGLIADAREVPEGEDAAYSETVLRLPDCYVCYDPPAGAPDPGPVPMLSGAPRFGCFQRAAKLNEGVFARWARIAAALPEARFLLRYGCYEEGETQRAVRAMAEAAGLAPERLEFEPGGDPAAMLAAYRRVDVVLDTAPYSGGVTTLEALWMGVPVVTLPGETFAGRHSASHLHAMGLQAWIARTDEEYASIAVRLARDAEALAGWRASLRERMLTSPLTDGPRFAAALERALLCLVAQRR